ncbi:MAG: LacI family DNA-binding transcriptional regulator [Candidatus Izemoplasmatales bacterium]
MVSIKEVAKAAGVSTSTVSRVVNNSPSISQNTKEKVWAIIKKLNYSPNNIAKALITNKSYTISLLVDVDDEKSFQNPFFYEIMHGIEKYCQEKEFSLMVANVNTKMKKQDMISWLVKTKRTEGVILPVSILNKELVKELKDMGIPFVAVGEVDSIQENVSWVDIDNKKGTEKAVYYLYNQGYKDIAFIGLDKSKDFSKRRLEGYVSAIDRLSLKISDSAIIECDNSKEQGYIQMNNLLNLDKRPDAIVCGNDSLSVGVIKAITDKGLKIPEDIGIISFDSRQIASLLYPEVTTVDVDVFEMGFQSAKMLFDLIENNNVTDQGLLISTKIIKRNTTK